MTKPSRFRPEDYRAYLRWLAQTQALRATAGKFDASDLVQECLLKAHVHRDQFAGSLEKEYRAWLRSILANVILEMARRFAAKARMAALEQSIHATIGESGRRLDELLIRPVDAPSTQVARRETIDAALAAIDRLPADQQEAIRLHHLEQLSIDEVAAMMKRTPASAAGLIRRGLAQLRSTLRRSADNHE
jgi:RNA polymerase sigma-70 factor (ECF subfamily)